MAPDNSKRETPSRQRYLDLYLRELSRAIQDGADVRGYFCWTLMDNFEWDSGYSLRFGLIHVNHQTQERTIKDSGYWYRALIQSQTKGSTPQDG